LINIEVRRGNSAAIEEPAKGEVGKEMGVPKGKYSIIVEPGTSVLRVFNNKTDMPPPEVKLVSRTHNRDFNGQGVSLISPPAGLGKEGISRRQQKDQEAQEPYGFYGFTHYYSPGRLLKLSRFFYTVIKSVLLFTV
jgi:hypothetical protein